MGECVRLLLVRHGQASLGTQDYDRLSAPGQSQARALAARLRGTVRAEALVCAGTLRRHRQTIAPALEHLDAVDFTPALDEFSTDGLIRSGLANARRLGLRVPPSHQLSDPVGHLDELLGWFPEVLAAWQEERFADARAGRWQDFRQRVLEPVPGWNAALERGQSVIAVTSAGVIATLAAELAERSLAWQRELAVSLYNASVTELARVDGRWELLRLNDIEHLRPDCRITRA